MINDLDLILCYLNEHREPFLAQQLTQVMGNRQNEFSVIDSDIIVDKLQKDGYVTGEPHPGSHITFYTYFISVEGILFLERSILKNRPYRSELIIKNIKNVWAVARIIMAAISTLAIIWISWLTYEAQRDANLLEKIRKQEPPPIINVIIDTTKKK